VNVKPEDRGDPKWRRRRRRRPVNDFLAAAAALEIIRRATPAASQTDIERERTGVIHANDFLCGAWRRPRRRRFLPFRMRHGRLVASRNSHASERRAAGQRSRARRRRPRGVRDVGGGGGGGRGRKGKEIDQS